MKYNIFLITIEFLLVTYILLDIYASVFFGPHDEIGYPEDNIVGINATNEDPKVVGIGNFAVDEYNKITRGNLKMESVVKALFAQSSYMLLIQAGNGAISESKMYAAIVVMVQGDRMSLVAFDEYMGPGM